MRRSSIPISTTAGRYINDLILQTKRLEAGANNEEKFIRAERNLRAYIAKIERALSQVDQP